MGGPLSDCHYQCSYCSYQGRRYHYSYCSCCSYQVRRYHCSCCSYQARLYCFQIFLFHPTSFYFQRYDSFVFLPNRYLDHPNHWIFFVGSLSLSCWMVTWMVTWLVATGPGQPWGEPADPFVFLPNRYLDHPNHWIFFVGSLSLSCWMVTWMVTWLVATGPGQPWGEPADPFVFLPNRYLDHPNHWIFSVGLLSVSCWMVTWLVT